jgi:hypothetical protein
LGLGLGLGSGLEQPRHRRAAGEDAAIGRDLHGQWRWCMAVMHGGGAWR